MIRFAVNLVLVLALAASLAACGRKGAPKPPEGAVYPRVYPHIEGAKPQVPAGEEDEELDGEETEPFNPFAGAQKQPEPATPNLLKRY